MGSPPTWLGPVETASPKGSPPSVTSPATRTSTAPAISAISFGRGDADESRPRAPRRSATAEGSASSRSSHIEWNSRLSKRSLTSFRSHSRVWRSSISTPMSRSSTRAIRSLLRNTCSRWAARFSLSFGVWSVDRQVDARRGPVIGDQAGCGLLPHPGHPGEVVRGVAPERGVLDVLVGPDPVPLLDPRLVGEDRVADPTAGVDHPHRSPDQLEGVPIPGDDEDLPSGGRPRSW